MPIDLLMTLYRNEVAEQADGRHGAFISYLLQDFEERFLDCIYFYRRGIVGMMPFPWKFAIFA